MSADDRDQLVQLTIPKSVEAGMKYIREVAVSRDQFQLLAD
jgi:hypothetical protein